MLKKTLLSSAIAAALVSGSAFAGQLQYATTETGTVDCNAAFTGSNNITNCGIVTFADEMFGPNSTTTKANLQNIEFAYKAGNKTAQLAAGDTVKLSVTNTSAIFSTNLTASQFTIGAVTSATTNGFTLQNNANVLSLQLGTAGAAELNSAATATFFATQTLIDSSSGTLTLPAAAGSDLQAELTALGITAAGTYYVNNVLANAATTNTIGDGAIGDFEAALVAAGAGNTNNIVEVVITGTVGSLAVSGTSEASTFATTAAAAAVAVTDGTVSFNFRSLDSNTNLPGGLTNVTGSLSRVGSGFDTETQKFVTLSAQVDASDADARDQAQAGFKVQQSEQAVTVQTRAIDTSFVKAINVGEGSSSKSFSDTASEFSSAAATARFNAIGALRVDVRDNTRNEDALNDFGLNADDALGIVLSSTTFAGLSNAVLVDLGALATLATSTDTAVKAACQGLSLTDLNGASDNNVVLAIAGGVTSLSLNVTNSQVERNFAVCLVADTTTEIEEITINGDASINYSNVRYLDSIPASGVFATLFKNGCSATVFNLPKPQSTDDFFIRLTNTSASTSGAVQSYMFLQDGTRVPATGSLTLIADLAAHETGAINATTIDTVFGGGLSTLADDATDGIVTWAGRSRLVMRGEFQTCEALGLVRTETGVLTNMTATTQGNEVPASSAANAGNNGN